MFDIREYLRKGNFGEAYLNMSIEEFRLSMPNPDYEQVADGSNIFMFYGDMELCFPEYINKPSHRLFYIQPKFMQLDGSCGQSSAFPFDMRLLKQGISINSFQKFCRANKITLEQLLSNDEDYDLYLIGKNVLGFFVSATAEDGDFLGLQKLITDSQVNAKKT